MSTLTVAIITGCGERSITVSETDVEIIQEDLGLGPVAREGDVVTIGYEVHLPDQTLLLSDDRFKFQLGKGAVIEGIDQTVMGMRSGGRRIVLCPPGQHWGRSGYGDGAIPPDTTLTLEVRLHELSR